MPNKFQPTDSLGDQLFIASSPGHVVVDKSASGVGISSTVGEGNLVSLTAATVSSGSITLDATNEAAVIDTQGHEGVALTVSGFGTATIAVQWSNLPTSGFTAGLVTTVGTTSAVSTITANGQYTAPSGGRYLRIIVTAYTSGTLVVTPTLQAGGISSSSGGGVSQGAVTTAAPAYANGTNQNLSLTEKGGLRATLIDAAGAVIDFTATAPVTQSGTWTVQPGNTANTTPWLFTGSGSAATPATGVLSAQGFVADDAAAGVTNPLAVGGIYRAARPAYADGDRVQAHFGSGGELIIMGGGTVAAPAAGIQTVQGLVADDAAAGTTNPVATGGIHRATLPTYTDGDRTQAHYNSQGLLLTAGPIAANGAAGAETAVFPAPVGGDFRATLPTYADGDRVVAQFTSRGLLQVALSDANGSVATAAPLTDTLSNASRFVMAASAGLIFDGTGLERVRSIDGSFGAATGVMAVENAGASLSYIAAAATTQVKTGAGILHKIIVNTPVTAATIDLIDNTAGAVINIGRITCQNTNPFELSYDVAFAAGLRIITSGATDITVVYR